MAANNKDLASDRTQKTVLSVLLAIVCIIWVLPVIAVIVNSFKLNTYVKTDTFSLPSEESFAGLQNFVTGMTFGNYPFWKAVGYSAFITVAATFLILLCCSIAT